MRHPHVPVPMGMRFRDRPLVGVLMVLVMLVLMLVVQHFVRVHMLVPLGEMLLDTLLGQFKRGVFSRYKQDERFATYEPPRPRPVAAAATTAEPN